MESKVRARSFVLFGALFVTAACADDFDTAPITRTPILRREVSGPTARRGPTRFANSIKYRDKGKKNARGFAATASLEVRALLGMDGNTTLDVATGTIDNPDPSRLLNKIQVKQYAPNGALQTTTNYKDLSSSTYQATLAGRVRGSKLGVQGTVVGVDGKHSDVISTTETVKLRPDVSVDRILAPARSPLQTPVQISALISENNGDVGARADCVLAVDGVDVGRANGIWVDAGRSVSCVFNHTFATKGTKQLAVRAISVNPGDWNASNNSFTQAITIYVPNDIAWFGSYTAIRDWVGTRLMEGFYIETDNGARTDYRQLLELRRYDTWSVNIGGTVPGLTGPLTFALHDEIDGQPLTDFQFDPATATSLEFGGTYEDPDFGTVTYHGNCTDQQRLEQVVYEGVTVNVSPAFVRMCSQVHSNAAGPIPSLTRTDFNYGTNAGDVSYYTEDYQKYDDNDPNANNDYTYSFNGDVDYSYGNLTFGTDYSFVFKLSGPDQTKWASGTIHATTFQNVVSQQYSCEDFDIEIFTGRQCSSGEYRQTTTSGNAQGVPDQP
jgi:hypothetical protein